MRTLVPWDLETVKKSVQKTGRCLVLQEDTFRGSFGADISHVIQRECFEYLDAPVEVLSSADIPIPFSAELERGFLANYRLDEVIKSVVRY